jgi:nitric oxide reductase subunit C
MLSKSQARIFFLGGTGLFSAAFLSLTIDTHAKIPAQTHEANITAEVVRGKRLWESNNCMGCHTLFGEGAYYAPELTKVVERRGKPWLRVFLKDPEAMFPNDRKMVNYHFSDEQIDNAIAFLEWAGTVDLNGFPPKPPLAAKMTPPAAPLVATTKPIPPLFDAMACTGCHSIGGKGGLAGAAIGAPPLDDVYKRKNKAQIVEWVTNPLAIKPDTKMPKLPLSPEQINEIADFLTSLGN